MKPAKRSLERYFTANNAIFIVLGCVVSLCVLGYAYEWLKALHSGVHMVYIRGRPSKTFTLDASATAYWMSMGYEAVRIIVLTAMAGVMFYVPWIFRK